MQSSVRPPAFLRSSRCLAIAWLTLLALGEASLFAQENQRSATVGMPARINQIVIPGSELVAADLTDDVLIVLRIVATYPHGTDFRYDLEYHGREPGTYDLLDFLEPKDGSTMEGTEPIEVEITPILPLNEILPSDPKANTPPFIGGYRLFLIVGGILWALMLFALIFLGRKKRLAAEATAAKPLTLAERLRPMVVEAMAGELTPPRRAELERILLAFWRKKLGIADEDPAVALRRLRDHDEAGPLLQELEAWLYRGDAAEQVNINELLEPYRNIAADDVIEDAREEA